jgi:hypothetical protein
MSSEILKKEARCQMIEKPEDLPEDAVKQRMDCAWMFNPTGRSGATLCSIAGPVLSTSRNKFPNTTYKFLWSKGEAIKKERIKLCALTKNCNLLTPGNGCGFCPELGYAVPANPNGSSIYEEAKCPYNAVTNPNQCYKPRAEGGGAVPGVQNSDICKPDSAGRLSKACLGALAQQASCTDSGTILRALNSLQACAYEINKARNKYFSPSLAPYRWIAEPGRFFASSFFTLYVPIIGKKRRVDGEGWRYTINESIYGSFSNIPFDHQKPKPIPLKISGRVAKIYPAEIYGRTCDSGDCLGKDFMMPEMDEGDWLRFDNMGAYTTVTASEFNGFPKPELYIEE